jgi:hypothetical protein
MSSLKDQPCQQLHNITTNTTESETVCNQKPKTVKDLPESTLTSKIQLLVESLISVWWGEAEIQRRPETTKEEKETSSGTP